MVWKAWVELHTCEGQAESRGLVMAALMEEVLDRTTASGSTVVPGVRQVWQVWKVWVGGCGGRR